MGYFWPCRYLSSIPPSSVPSTQSLPGGLSSVNTWASYRDSRSVCSVIGVLPKAAEVPPSSISPSPPSSLLFLSPTPSFSKRSSGVCWLAAEEAERLPPCSSSGVVEGPATCLLVGDESSSSEGEVASAGYCTSCCGVCCCCCCCCCCCVCRFPSNLERSGWFAPAFDWWSELSRLISWSGDIPSVVCCYSYSL